ncbi:MAG: Ribosome hibernation promoting factor [Planctomycetota bacterium]|jgi:putative sigma-54 modulation protein
MTAPNEVVIEFTNRHEHLSERMQENAARKIARLARYNDRVTRIEVIADHAHKKPEVEFIVHLRRGRPLVAKETGESFAALVDLLLDRMEAQLRKQKEKRKDHKGNVAGKGSGKPSRRPVRARGGKAGDEETYEDIVRRSLKG